jgi:hypothetical protein
LLSVESSANIGIDAKQQLKPRNTIVANFFIHSPDR